MSDEHPAVVKQTFLTIKRLPDGRLKPYIGDDEIIGSVDVTVNANSTQQLVQLVFHASVVHFETADNPARHLMH